MAMHKLLPIFAVAASLALAAPVKATPAVKANKPTISKINMPEISIAPEWVMVRPIIVIPTFSAPGLLDLD